MPYYSPSPLALSLNGMLRDPLGEGEKHWLVHSKLLSTGRNATYAASHYLCESTILLSSCKSVFICGLRNK